MNVEWRMSNGECHATGHGVILLTFHISHFTFPIPPGGLLP